MGVPLEIKINEELGYSQIILKADSILPEYTRFPTPLVVRDKFGNVRQYKLLLSIDIAQIKLEIEKLTHYAANK
ncbi:MAG: hypothetical protein QXL88_00375 [Candidatus Pacearchaeota archaeon]